MGAKFYESDLVGTLSNNATLVYFWVYATVCTYLSPVKCKITYYILIIMYVFVRTPTCERVRRRWILWEKNRMKHRRRGETRTFHRRLTACIIRPGVCVYCSVGGGGGRNRIDGPPRAPRSVVWSRSRILRRFCFEHYKFFPVTFPASSCTTTVQAWTRDTLNTYSKNRSQG